MFVVFIVYGVNARPLQTFFICIVKKQKEKINYGLPGTVIVEQVYSMNRHLHRRIPSW